MPKKGKKEESSDEEGSDEEVAEAAAQLAGAKINGYPLETLYCEICSCPPEYCAWMGAKPGQIAPECKAWLCANHPDLAAKYGYEVVKAVAAEGSEGVADSKDDGSKAAAGKKAAAGAEKKEVLVSSKQRQKNKFVCMVRGLEKFGVKLPDACKIFKKKFSCGASVVETPDNKEEIEIQGNVKDEVVPVIVKELGIEKANIFYVEGTGAKLTKVPVD